MVYRVKESDTHFLIVNGKREVAKFVKADGMKEFAESSCRRLNERKNNRE